jgi:nucleotide-binding universal stress UspA family protein
MFKKILIALKFSPAGLHAFNTALRLARSYDAQLYVFHALDYHLKDLDRNDPKLTEALRTVDDQIKNNLHPHLAEQEKVFIEYAPADPALEACRMAKSLAADLIVVGCHQTHRDLSMGRVDYVGMTILEKAPCAVMLIPLDAASIDSLQTPVM